MRKHAEWMAQLDDRILEFLQENGAHRRWELRNELRAAGHDMAYPKKYVEFRTAALLTHGLVERRRNGRFEITDRGRAYLAGGLDVGSLDEQHGSRTSPPEDDGGSRSA